MQNVILQEQLLRHFMTKLEYSVKIMEVSPLINLQQSNRGFSGWRVRDVQEVENVLEFVQMSELEVQEVDLERLGGLALGDGGLETERLLLGER